MCGWGGGEREGRGREIGGGGGVCGGNLSAGRPGEKTPSPGSRMGCYDRALVVAGCRLGGGCIHGKVPGSALALREAGNRSSQQGLWYRPQR